MISKAKSRYQYLVCYRLFHKQHEVIMNFSIYKIVFFLCVIGLLSNVQSKTLYVIDIGYQQSGVTLGEKFAVLSCQGLMNRVDHKRQEEVAVYTIKESWDQLWLDTALTYDPDWNVTTVSIEEYVSEICEKENFSRIFYSKSMHHEVIPQIVTIAGVLDAVPFDVDTHMDEIATWASHDVVFDARVSFLDFTELKATQYIFENYAHLTTGVAVMNPGWKQPDDLHPIQHELVRDPDVGLSDFIIKEKIFNFFLYTGCVPFTDAHTLLRKMMNADTPWKKPVEVYGYNDAVNIFGGSVFEAETNCIQEHNMGQVPSSGQNNFSFFNRKNSIQSPNDLNKYLESLMKTRDDIAQGTLVYDPSITYMSFIVGDGDNTAFMKGGRRGWMDERIQHCQENECSYPLCWSISPHLLYMAPDWLIWYYEQANNTGHDVFVLPPSGHLYSYPGMMIQNETIQNNFIDRTQSDCNLLTTTSSVHWEWFYGWHPTFENYFPKYAIDSDIENSKKCVRSFFATNVPYNLPTPIEWPWNEHFRVLDGDVIVFKPREWRGTNKDDAPIFGEHNYLTVEEMAAEINNYNQGSVSHLYLTSDGGMNLPTLYKMVEMLENHVKVVNHEELTEMARQKASQSKLKK